MCQRFFNQHINWFQSDLMEALATTEILNFKSLCIKMLESNRKAFRILIQPLSQNMHGEVRELIWLKKHWIHDSLWKKKKKINQLYAWFREMLMKEQARATLHVNDVRQMCFQKSNLYHSTSNIVLVPHQNKQRRSGFNRSLIYILDVML